MSVFFLLLNEGPFRVKAPGKRAESPRGVCQLESGLRASLPLPDDLRVLRVPVSAPAPDFRPVRRDPIIIVLMVSLAAGGTGQRPMQMTPVAPKNNFYFYLGEHKKYFFLFTAMNGFFVILNGGLHGSPKNCWNKQNFVGLFGVCRFRYIIIPGIVPLR